MTRCPCCGEDVEYPDWHLAPGYWTCGKVGPAATIRNLCSAMVVLLTMHGHAPTECRVCDQAREALDACEREVEVG